MTSAVTAERPSPIVHRLPVELLIMIYGQLVASSRKSHILNKPSHITAISQVSRRWRSVALATDSVWARIELPASIDSIRTFLERSRNALLTISLKCTDFPLSSNIITSLRFIFEAASHRIWSLELPYTSARVYSAVASLLPPIMPGLRELHLYVDGYESLPAPAIDLSMLLCLDFNISCWSWEEIQRCTSLQELHVKYERGSSSEVPFILDKARVDEVQLALQSLPGLREITILAHWEDPLERPSRRFAQPADLPNLQKLVLGYDALPCSTLLSGIKCPSTTSLSFSIDPSHGEPYGGSMTFDDYAACWSLVSEKVAFTAGHPIQSAVVRYNSPTGTLQVRAWKPLAMAIEPRLRRTPWRPAEDMEWSRSIGDALLDLVLPFSPRELDLSFKDLPVADVSRLWLDAVVLGHRDAQVALREFVGAQEVHVYGSSVQDVASLLTRVDTKVTTMAETRDGEEIRRECEDMANHAAPCQALHFLPSMHTLILEDLTGGTESAWLTLKAALSTRNGSNSVVPMRRLVVLDWAEDALVMARVIIGDVVEDLVCSMA